MEERRAPLPRGVFIFLLVNQLLDANVLSCIHLDILLARDHVTHLDSRVVSDLLGVLRLERQVTRFALVLVR